MSITIVITSIKNKHTQGQYSERGQPWATFWRTTMLKEGKKGKKRVAIPFLMCASSSIYTEVSRLSSFGLLEEIFFLFISLNIVTIHENILCTSSKWLAYFQLIEKVLFEYWNQNIWKRKNALCNTWLDHLSFVESLKAKRCTKICNVCIRGKN